MEKKKFEVGTPLEKDVSKIAKIKRDLVVFTEMLNGEIDKIVNEGFLQRNELTIELVNDLATFNDESLLKQIRENYATEADDIKYKPARDKFLEQCQDAVNSIHKQIERFKEETEKAGLSKGLYIRGAHERLPFLTLNDKYVSYSTEKVEERYTYKVESESQAEYLNKAYEVFEALQELQRETTKFTKGSVVAITSESIPSVIEIDFEKLIFHPEATNGYRF